MSAPPDLDPRERGLDGALVAPVVEPTLTRLELTGLADSIIDGARLPAHVALLVVVTDVRSGQQGESRKTPVRE